MFDATATQGIVTSMLTDLSDVLTANIPLVMGVVAALIGLYFVIRLFKKHVK